MKRLLFFILLCPFTQVVAQHESFEDFVVDSFPKVSFIYHDYNPQVLNISDLGDLKEGTEKRSFDVKVIQKDNSKTPQYTLILWEDMAQHELKYPGQFDFTQKVLSQFFIEARISNNDKFQIAVFNRRKNDPSALKKLTAGFIDDDGELCRAILQYQRSKDEYPEFPNRSDMYTAIREGLELIRFFDGVKCIIVFTAGYPMINSGSDSASQVLLLAQRLHIPVYIFQYYNASGVATESEGFAKATNGIFTSYKDVTTAKMDLLDLYPKIRKRYYGYSYQIRFTSEAKRGDDARIISFNLNGQEYTKKLVPPPFSFKVWIKENPVLFTVLLILSIAIVVVVVWYIRKTILTNKQKRADKDIELQNKISNSNMELENMKKQLSSQKKITEEQRLYQIEQRLYQLMQNKNLYPRLHCLTNNEQFVYTMQKPRITIGRNEDNDVVLHNDKVSRYHAKVVFNEKEEFEIIDNHSTNKVIVNGSFFKQTVLKNGDKIGLGEAVIVFYL